VSCGTILLCCSALTTTLVASEAHPPKTLPLPLIEGRAIRFRRLPTTAGLSQTRVSDIVQDDDGFIWFGTQYGLNRFDGYKCKVFRHDSQRPDSLSGVYIHTLFKDRSGFIWVASDSFLDRLDPVTEAFTHYPLVGVDGNGLPTNTTHISQDTSGFLWLSTNMGLFRLDPTTGQYNRFVHDPRDSATIGDDDVKSTGQDREGRFWIATSQTLDEFDRGTGKVTRHVAIPNSGIGVRFHEDRFGVFWIFSGDDGLPGTFDRTSGQLTRFQFSPGPRQNRTRNRVNAMLEDHNGNMWFGTFDKGVLVFDREHRRFVSYGNRPGDNDSLADDYVTTLFEDREGVIWLGLQQVEPNFFTTKPPLFEKFTHQSGNPSSLEAPLVSALYQGHEGLLWVGSDRGVTLINRTTGRYSSFKPIVGTGSTVFSIVEQVPNIIWFGTSNGIKRFDRTTGELKQYLYPSVATSACDQSTVERLLLDKDGTLWGATWDGLCRFDPDTKRFTTFRPEANSRGLNYHAIALDKGGKVWLGSEIGLHRFDPLTSRFTIYGHRADDAHSLSNNRVTSVYVDHAGTLWAGTQNGLNKFDPQTGSFSAFGEQQGMNGNVVSCMLEDGQGSLWMSTNKGVSNFDPKTGSFKNYTVADGLPGNDLTGWGACFKSTAGEMFFGGFSGATAFFPDRVSDDTFISPIVLTDFRLFGKSVPIGKASFLRKSLGHTSEVTLSHSQNMISIEFSALNYLNAETNRFRYRLDSVEATWNEVESNQRMAAYTTLPYGSYTFRVEAATPHGQWHEPGTSLRITILPAWWQTFWFRSLCVFTGLVILWLAYTMRFKQVTRGLQDRMHERLAERERIARDLHDTFFQDIIGLFLRFHTATSQLPPDEPARSIFENALRRSDDVMKEGRELLMDLRSTAGGTKDLQSALAEAGRRLQDLNPCEFKVIQNGEARDLHLVVCDELSQIGKEALNNAFRHSHASQIEAEVHYEPNQLRLRIRDDGDGIEPKILEQGHRSGHWGLPDIRERAKKIGAHVELWSQSGAGTEVELRIPAQLAYASEANASSLPWFRRAWKSDKAMTKHN
jgi:ligand-binding sensor domain-containing protein/signal transduction histidine kinase